MKSREIISEKLLEAKLRDSVKKIGGLALKFFCMSVTGVPDRIVLMPGGKVYFAEMKTTGKKPSPRQVIMIGILRKLGFYVAVIDDHQTLNDFLAHIDDL